MRRDVRIRRFDILRLFGNFLRIMTGLALINTWIRDGILFAVAHFAGDAHFDVTVLGVIGCLCIQGKSARQSKHKCGFFHLNFPFVFAQYKLLSYKKVFLTR